MKYSDRIYKIIFETDTRAGKIFDIILIISIVLSVIIIFLDSVSSIKSEYMNLLTAVEWGFTILFTLEYFARIYCSPHAKSYIFSPFGLIDLFSILPSYLSTFMTGIHYLQVIRILRVLRVFRILKLVKFLGEAQQLASALTKSMKKIIVFLVNILTLVVILGAIMYLVEGPENGFTSIPRSVYWAIVTITTVGYGDVSPHTPLGQTIAAIIMLLGFGIIAIPTGIVTAELASGSMITKTQNRCPQCSLVGHDFDAKHCKVCGTKLF